MPRKTNCSYTVTGRGNFPIDMLRYDAAWPMTGDDAANITATFQPRAGRWTIKLASARLPTEGRWSSFVCLVSDIVMD